MRLRKYIAILLLVLGIFMALISIPASDAISREQLYRNVSAHITDDFSSKLLLEGFNGQSYNINNKFSNFCKIINNTDKTLRCNIIINIDFNKTPNKNCSLGFKVSDAEGYVTNNGSNTVVLDIVLLPMQSYNFEALLDRNQNSPVFASFDISAESDDGSLRLQLIDSISSPRCVTFY